MKKIALILNCSNFEKHQKIVKAVHRALKEIGDCALYVVSSYGIYQTDSAYNQGELSIYQLFGAIDFDGCLIEGNLIGNYEIIQRIRKDLEKRGIPCVTLNFQMEGVPAVLMDYYEDERTLIEHLVREHQCKKINLVLNTGAYLGILERLTRAYQDVLRENGIEVEERRSMEQPVSLENGRKLFHRLRENGLLDADAVVFQHDATALGFCMECEKYGFRIPEDLRIVSMNYTMNSAVFRPDVTGMEQRDDNICMEACRILMDVMGGAQVPQETFVHSSLCLGKSCGCQATDPAREQSQHRELIINKIESGGQISLMMRFNDALEKVSALDELGDCIQNLLESIGCGEFACCLNEGDIDYLLGKEEEQPRRERAFDDRMTALVQVTERGGKLRGFSFPLGEVMPAAPEEGDICMIYPLHHLSRVMGYLVILNSYFPIEQQNYRICHDSICSSLENLHRQMLMRKVISQLDEYHMQDKLTGLYNRFAIGRFEKRFTESGAYTVVIMDIDSLKHINDTFGHLAGDHAISIAASAIRKFISEGDIAIRYGGDEFLILSCEDGEVWSRRRIQINDWLEQHGKREALPFELGISIGYAVSTEGQPKGLDELSAMADRAMYEEKARRKGQGGGLNGTT